MTDEERLTELEIRLALQDDLLDTLNSTVASQQLLLDRLHQEIRTLRDYVRALEPAGRGSPAEERPPHY